MSKCKIVFIGGTKRGFQLLKKLIASGEEITGIIGLREDEHECLKYHRAIEALATRYKIPALITKKITEDHLRDIREVYQPDLIIIVGWRTILPESIYKYPRYGCVAVHDSLLPNYRGFAPTNWAIINGEKETGVTLFELTGEVDAGPIIGQKKIKISEEDTAPEVNEKVIEATIQLVLENLERLKTGTAIKAFQEEVNATYTCSRLPSDGLIDWSKTTREIYNLIRGLTWPYPGAFTYYQGKKLIIWSAKIPDNSPVFKGRIYGRVVKILEGGVDVLTGDGILRVNDVQLEGKERMKANNLIRSVRDTLGIDMVKLMEKFNYS
jgi:methionyl-tRNA formyltransferase